MPTRRTVVLAGATIATAASLGAVPLPTGRRSGMPIYRIAFDRRFGASRLFAAEAARLGAVTREVGGGVHDLWHDELYHCWRSSAIAIAGMTTHAALFCLDMMARDAGMQTIYRVHHQTHGAQVLHAAFGPRELLAGSDELSAVGADWPRAAAQRLMTWPAGLVPLASARSNIADAALKSVDAQTLITWIIAPVRHQRFLA